MSQRRSHRSSCQRRRHRSPSSSERSLSPIESERPSLRRGLRRLIQEKELELEEINEYRERSIASLAAAKDAEVDRLKAQQIQIRSDFAYNLKLLEERDAELDRYDALFGKISSQLKSRDEEVNRLNDIIHEQTSTIAAFQEQIRTQHEKHRKEAYEREHEYETLNRDHHEQLLGHHNIINTLKNEHQAVLNTRSKQFQSNIDELKERHQQEIHELNRLHNAELSKLRQSSDQRQRESEAEIQEIEAKLRLAELSKEESSMIAQTMLSEKDDQLRLLEEENGKLVQMKHELLLNYEEKIGEVLGSLHELEQQFGQQRLSFQSRMQQVASERDQLLSELKQVREQSDKETGVMMSKVNQSEQNSEELLKQLELTKELLEKHKQDHSHEIMQLENRCLALQQIVDQRNEHVAVLKDLVRSQNETIQNEEQSNANQQQRLDNEVYKKVSQAQERLENLVQSLLSSDSNGSAVSAVNLAEQADHLTELQSGLMSIKKTIHSHSSSLSRASSRRTSLISSMPRTEQILAEIPDIPSTPSSRRLSSTVIRPMEVEIIRASAANLTVDLPSPEHSGLEQIVELSTDDDDAVSSHHERNESVLSNISEIVNCEEAVLGHPHSLSAASSERQQSLANLPPETLAPVSPFPSSSTEITSSQDWSPASNNVPGKTFHRSSSSSNLVNRRGASLQSSSFDRQRHSDDLSKLHHYHNSLDLKMVNVETVEIGQDKDVRGNKSDKTIRSRKASRVIGSLPSGLPTVSEQLGDDDTPHQLSSSEIIECEQGDEMRSSLKNPSIAELQERANASEHSLGVDAAAPVLIEQHSQTMTPNSMPEKRDQSALTGQVQLQTSSSQTIPVQEDRNKTENALNREIEFLKDEIKQQSLMIEVLKKQTAARADHKECQTKISNFEHEIERCNGELRLTQVELQDCEKLRRQALKDLDVLKEELEAKKDAAVANKAVEAMLNEAHNQIEILQTQLKLLQQKNLDLNQQLIHSRDEDHRSEGERILAELQEMRQHNDDALLSSKASNDEKHYSLVQENEKLRQIVQDMKKELGSIQTMQQAMTNEMSILKQAKKDQERHIESLVNLLDDVKPGVSSSNETLQHLAQIDKMNTKLVEMSSRLTEVDMQLLEKDRHYKKKAIEHERDLNDLRHQLRLAHKRLQRQQDQTLSHHPDAENDHTYLAEFQDLTDRLNESNHLLVEYREAKEKALEQLRQAETERDSLKLQLDQQFRLVDILKIRLASDQAPRSKSRVDDETLASLRKENKLLRQHLEEAKNDLSELDAEKDKLMEISNMLKANISMLTANESPLDIPLSHIDFSGEVTNAYNAKLANLERTLRDLLRQNQLLKTQIASFTANGSSNVSFHKHPGSSEYCIDPLCQLRHLHSQNAALSNRDAYQAQLLNKIDQLGHDIQHSLKSTAAPLVVSDIKPEPPGEIDTIPQQQPVPESRARQRLRHELGDFARVSAQDKALDSAKRNFRTARQALMSANGRTMSLHATPGEGSRNVSAEEREYQREQRKLRDAKKRSTIVRRLQAIRNYNEKD